MFFFLSFFHKHNLNHFRLGPSFNRSKSTFQTLDAGTMALAASEDQPIACPEGFADFSYNWTGVPGFPNGGPLSNGQEIGPNIELDAWLI